MPVRWLTTALGWPPCCRMAAPTLPDLGLPGHQADELTAAMPVDNTKGPPRNNLATEALCAAP
jgi:hypothetical protein